MNDNTTEQQKQKKMKKIIFISLALIVVTLILFITRGPYISNVLKKILLPELEAVSGQRVTAQKIYLNLFPLFVGAEGIHMFDEDGNKIVIAEKVKGYVGLSGLLRRQLHIQRLIIKQPEVDTNSEQLKEIVENIKAYLEKDRKTFIEVKIKIIEVVKGSVHLADDAGKGRMSMRGLSGEFIPGEKAQIKTSVDELTVEKEGWPKIKSKINTSVVLREHGVTVKRLEISSNGSQFKGEGSYSEGKGTIKSEIALLLNSLKRIFHLKESGEGRISAKGEILLDKLALSKNILEGIVVDLKLKGNFYLQTLMELLKVHERLEGLIDFRGEISGHLSDITGKAKTRLRKGNLFNIEIDSLNCEVSYKNGIMRFEKGVASLYNGTAHAQASINIPVVDHFILGVRFQSVDSGDALRLIGWDPGIPPGKVEGELLTEGRSFNPTGWFAYASIAGGKRTPGKRVESSPDNVLRRIKDIKGVYSLRDGIVLFPNLNLSTQFSHIQLDGEVDLKKKTLCFKSKLSAEDIKDLTLPYYAKAQGRVHFGGDIAGPFSDPKISGKAHISNVLVEGYKADSFTSDFSYEKHLLDIREAVFKAPHEEHTVKGKIFFLEAKELFDVSEQEYSLVASLRNADFGKIIHIFYKDLPAEGRANADIRIRGKDEAIDISGNAFIQKASVYQIPFDSASTNFTYTNQGLSLKNVKITKGTSFMNAEGNISTEKSFSYKVSSERFLIKDLVVSHFPEDIVLSLKSEGRGTFDNPLITLSAKVTDGAFNGMYMGGGTLYATIKHKEISVDAALFNERMKLKGSGYFDNTLPWKAEMTFHPGRYDFLVGLVLKDVPEDLQLNIEGRVNMKGDKKTLNASAAFNNVVLTLFEQTFSNDSQISFFVENKKLSIKQCAMKSGTTSFRLSGGMEIGKEYDISLDGSSSLAPLKGLSKKIGYLKGDTEFGLSITGRWERPEINGSMNVTNGSFGLRDYPTYTSSINGNINFDKDRIVLQKLFGKIGGGDVNISGVIYLKAFRINRFYLEAKLQDISTTISEDFKINLGGNLLYKGTVERMTIAGDIKINSAKYKKMIEWRSWLVKAKRAEKPKAEMTAFERTELNIRITGGENISIDNNMVRAPIRIRGDMIVKGTVSDPILLGSLESTNGYIYFRNNQFEIIYASADFADPNRINPFINLTSETFVKGYKIRLNLEGQSERFNLALSSDPHLEEVDILALLTVGQVGKQLKGLEGGIGAGEATSFLTGKVQDVLEERLRTITGLDRFQVESHVSETTATVTPKVTVAKRLVGDKLFVTYSTLLGSTEEQIVKIEYLLNRQISLVGERDEIGSVGGDVKFRFEFK